MYAFTRMNANEAHGKRASERERWRPEDGRGNEHKKERRKCVFSAVWDQWRVSYFHESCRLIYIYCVSRVHCTKSALALSFKCVGALFSIQRYTHRENRPMYTFWFYASLECIPFHCYWISLFFFPAFSVPCNSTSFQSRCTHYLQQQHKTAEKMLWFL